MNRCPRNSFTSSGASTGQEGESVPQHWELSGRTDDAATTVSSRRLLPRRSRRGRLPLAGPRGSGLRGNRLRSRPRTTAQGLCPDRPPPSTAGIRRSRSKAWIRKEVVPTGGVRGGPAYAPSRRHGPPCRGHGCTAGRDEDGRPTVGLDPPDLGLGPEPWRERDQVLGNERTRRPPPSHHASKTALLRIRKSER